MPEMEIALVARCIIAATLLLSAVGKAVVGHSTVAASTRGLGVPARFAPLVTWSLGVIEPVIALLLLPRSTAFFAAVSAALLLGAFTYVLVRNLARGNRPACNCFGALTAKPISWLSVARNVALIALSLVVISGGRARVGPGMPDWVGTHLEGWKGAGPLVVLLSFAVLVESYALVLLRHRQISGDASGRLAIGSKPPAFELRGLDERSVRLSDLLAHGRSTLLLFVDPECTPCRSLLPEVAGWETTSDLTVAVISRDAVATRAEVSDLALANVLVHDDPQLLSVYGVSETPTGILLDADGRVLHPGAAGAPAIRALVATVTNLELDVPPLPLSAVAPLVQLADRHGVEQTVEFSGNLTIVLAWDDHCPYCRELATSMPRREGYQLVSLVRGHGRAAPGGLVLADHDGATTRAFGLSGTPTAVLIDANGRVASDRAEGVEDVQRLLARAEVLSRLASAFPRG